MPRRKEPAIPDELFDQVPAGGAASAAYEQGGVLDTLRKAPTERALNAEMDHYLAGEDGWQHAQRLLGQRYSAITLNWRRNWDHVVSFLAFPEGVRRVS